MKFGVCCPPDRADAILSVGFDYIEIAASSLHGEQEEFDLASFSGIPILSSNGFFPGTIRLYGPDATPYLDYAKRTIERAAEIGIGLMVLGSGGARKSAPGVDAEKCFVEIAAELDQIASPYGIRVAPESLNFRETDVGNQMGKLAQDLKSSGVGFTADSYHLLVDWDAHHRRSGDTAPPEGFWVREIPFAPLHVHFANLPRTAPTADDPMVQGFVSRLQALHYDALVSLECSIDDHPDALSQARQHLSRLFN